MTRNAIFILVMFPALSITSACAIVSSPKQVGLENAAATEPKRATISDQQIALDFVNAIVQLVGPDTAPLAFSSQANDNGPVINTMREMLDKAGYGIKTSGDGANGQPVSQRVAEIDLAGERVQRYDVVVGRVELRRSYRSIDSGKVQPVSALFVRGGDAAAVQMIDEELFGPGTSEVGPRSRPALPDELLASYRHLLSNTPVIGIDEITGNDRRSGTAATPADDQQRSAEQIATANGAEDSSDSDELTPAANMRELGRSNYALWLNALDTVVEHALIFAPGSNRLDAADVALIDDVLEQFDPTTDVISIVGYSAGGAAGIEANRDMALSRAGRVRRALTAVGVPSELVFVEGHWGGSSSDGVPTRAAILSLRRGTI